MIIICMIQLQNSRGNEKEKKKNKTNLLTCQHLKPMRSSEAMGLSTYGETVRKQKHTLDR